MNNYVLKFDEWLNEAIKLSQAKKYTKAWPKKIQHRLDKVFGLDEKGRDRNRLYFPLKTIVTKGEEELSKLGSEISDFLNINGYWIEDYPLGLCKKIGSEKNIFKIGKVLNKLKNEELLKKFNEDTSRALVNKQRTGEKYIAVISRHPVDIAGMTSGRKWEDGSCMNLEKGIYKEYVLHDVKEGTLVAYLIKDDDKNIEDPISRLLIKPYINTKNTKDFLYVPMQRDAYGVENEDFRNLVNDWLDSWQSEKSGVFKFNCKLYQDYDRIKILKNPKFEDYIDKNGNINLSEQNLTKLPVNFSKLKGINNFYCSNNQLTSLEGAPKEVGGDFYCSNNQLTSLEGAPKEVGRNFYCSNNQLTSLEGAPKEVGGDFFCYKNQLTSLEGAPKEVGGDFDCYNNQLTSLEGAPKEVGRDFYCSYNQLTSLEGAPKEVGRDFDCSNNKVKFTRNDVKKVCNVKGKIFV